MNEYLPEGMKQTIPANRAILSGISAIKDAINQETVFESRVLLCDKDHALHIDLGIMKGIIPRNEGAIGIEDGSVRDIALISRVGKPVCFVITALKKNESGNFFAVLSRKRAQEKCMREYIEFLSPGDIVDVRVSHIESFGVFCDIGAGISALMPIDCISVSRIPHPSARFFVGQQIKAIVKSKDEKGRITLTHKELLGTWEENASLFSVGETVPGIVRSVENYGIFVELTPNLAGLAEFNSDVSQGESAAVYIKNIIPERMKIKLVIVDHGGEKPQSFNERYFYEGEHMSSFRYSPECCDRVNETLF